MFMIAPYLAGAGTVPMVMGIFKLASVMGEKRQIRNDLIFKRLREMSTWHPVEQRTGVDPDWQWNIRSHAHVNRKVWELMEPEDKDEYIQHTYGNKRTDPAYRNSPKIEMWSARTNIPCWNYSGEEIPASYIPKTLDDKIIVIYLYERRFPADWQEGDDDPLVFDYIDEVMEAIDEDDHRVLANVPIGRPNRYEKIAGLRYGVMPQQEVDWFPPDWMRDTFGDNPGAWAPLAIRRIEQWLGR